MSTVLSTRWVEPFGFCHTLSEPVSGTVHVRGWEVTAEATPYGYTFRTRGDESGHRRRFQAEVGEAVE